MNRMIEIKTPEQAEKINLLASKAPYEVWLSTDTVMLDARSLLGLLSLVGQRVRVVAEDNVNPKRFSRLVDAWSKPIQERRAAEAALRSFLFRVGKSPGGRVLSCAFGAGVL